MDDFLQTMTNALPVSVADQKKAGTPVGGDMGNKHKQFAVTISKLLESGEIDVEKPETFLNLSVYQSLDAEWKTKANLAMVNIADLLRHIYGFYKSKQTPDACPQLATMIEQLWEMKERIEVHADVFKF